MSLECFTPGSVPYDGSICQYIRENNKKSDYLPSSADRKSGSKSKNKSYNKKVLEKYIEEYRPAFAHRKNHKKDKITGKYELIGEDGVYRMNIKSNGRDSYFFLTQSAGTGISIWLDLDKNEKFCRYDDIIISRAMRDLSYPHGFLVDTIPKKGKFKLKSKASVFKDSSWNGLEYKEEGKLEKHYTPHNVYWQFGSEKFVYANYTNKLDKAEWSNQKHGQFVMGIDDVVAKRTNSLRGHTSNIIPFDTLEYKGLKLFKNKNKRGKGRVLSYYIPWEDKYVVPPTFEAVAAELDIAHYFGMQDNSSVYDQYSYSCSPSQINEWGYV